MKKELSAARRDELLAILKTRFDNNSERHKNVGWPEIQTKLEENPAKLWSLSEMENTGGEPDVIGHDAKTGEYIFCDCAAESPNGRRSICYDREARDKRKEHKPISSATEMATEIGISILTEDQYRDLQKFGSFDLKTSSWIATPEAIRKRGGAIFCDRRYDTVFTYHNGADSYYGARGFRGLLRV